MQGSGVDPDPGPAPPPSLTLPPLSELDKVIRPDAGPDHRYPHNMPLMGSQSRSQSQLSDPHLHSSMHQRPHYSGSSSSGSIINGLPPQHPQQLQMQQQHGGGGHPYQYQPSGHESRPPYPHDQHSRHSSSVGSLPDLYMSSPSAPSTTTTSSLSRADSLSSMEYLQGAHPGHSRRHLPSAGDMSSTTTGSSAGSSYGPSRSSISGSGRGSVTGSVMSGNGGRSLHHHHYHSSMGLGRANLSAAIHHQQQQLQLQQQQHQQHAMTTASSNCSASAVSNQRSSAAGGKDGSVNGHGNNSNGTGTGNSKSTGSSAGSEQGRNSTKRAAQNRAAQRAFRQRKDLYVRELERKAELLQEAEGQILQLAARNHELEVTLARHQQHQQQQQQQQQQQSSSSSSGSPQPLSHDPNHHPSPTSGATVANGAASEADHRPAMTRDTNEFDEFEYDRFSRSTRDPHPHHGSRQEAPSSPSLPPRLLFNRHESTPDIRSAYTRGRESEYDRDSGRPLHQQHQQQQEHLGRRGSNNSADSGDDHYGPATGRSDPGPDYHGATTRDGSMDYGLASAPSHYNGVAHQQATMQAQERPSLYRISTEGGRLGPLDSPAHNGSHQPSSARSWHEDSHNLRSPPQASFSPLGGMVRDQAGGMAGSPKGETEYMMEDRLPEGRPPAAAALYEGIKKRQSEGSFNWTGPRNSIRSSHHPALSKQSSWSAFPSSSSPSSSKAMTGNGGPVHLPPLNSHFRDHPVDTEMQETQSPQVRHDAHAPYPLQHRGSASSLSGGRDAERRMSGSEAGSMGVSRMAMSDSPDMSSSDSSRFTSSAMSMRYPPQQQQQQQQLPPPQHPQGRSSYPQTPENEYPPTLHSNGSPGQFRKRPDDHGSEMEAVYEHYPQHHLHPQHHRGLAVHEAMETAMRSP
ncbi:hypothetical protein EMPS_07976 [Entomortierella parvispora]|uniref:BZIP domain-containing protein n=1 Tax=Entomortierella parvispora TaxID=205924 RepID=A0A9P3HFU6_9FUNG|nr:hypothetical protein EMPS_07976 [Entomortierella parvispora]